MGNIGADLPPGIRVISATYGLACGIAQSNVTEQVAKQCDGIQAACTVHVSNSVFGDLGGVRCESSRRPGPPVVRALGWR